MIRSRPALTLLTFGAALVVAGIAPATTGLAEQAVIKGSLNQLAPAAEYGRGVDNLLWTTRPNLQPGRGAFNAYFRKGSNAKIKLNPKGRQGFTGGIDPPWIVYQQFTGSESNLKLYRIDRRRRSDPPKGVNTNDWEFSPTISGKWILFGRDDDESNLKRLILFNRSNRQARVLATINGENNNLYPGQVNGKWVVWTTCTSAGCDVFRYDSSARTKTKLDKPPGPATISQYTASVLSNGVVYAAHSGIACGETVRLVRFRSDDPSTGTEIATLPDGFDLGNGFARKRPNGSVDYLYDRVNCSTNAFDVYRVNDPPAP